MTSNMLSLDTEMQVPGNWYQVDFHVHSPASHDFVKSYHDDIEKEYADFVSRLYSAGLRVVVITDHNDIAGYQKIKEIEKDLRGAKRTLERMASPIPQNIQQQIDIFDTIIFLPGVELDVYPNIHLLVVFDPSKPIDEINAFLNEAGFPESVRGQRDMSRNAEWNVQNVYAKAKSLGAFVIAAHVDSDKGLYTESRQWGQQRINAFVNESLYAMEFNSPKVRDQIQNILKSPVYYRETRISFVQSSDYHGRSNDQIGKKITWVRLDVDEWTDVKVFHSLKIALRNPDEYISAPGRPEIKEIQARLSDNPASVDLETEHSRKYLTQCVCAYANSEDGTFVVGRNEHGNWLGITGDPEDIKSTIRQLIDCSITPVPRYFVEVYPYYGDKYFATVRIRKNSTVCSLIEEDRVYILDGESPRVASTEEVVQLAEEKFLQRYEHLSITNRLSAISRRLSGARDSIDILPIVRKIEANTIQLYQLLPPPHSGDLLTLEIRKKLKVDFMFNGLPEGNISVLVPSPPRTNEHYIRFTAPLGYYYEKRQDEIGDVTIFSGEKIIVVPKGAVYFDAHDELVVMCEQWSPLVLQPNSHYNGPPVKFIAAYLKTAIPIWYAERCIGSVDIREKQVLGQIPIPATPSEEDVAKILGLADRLIELEQHFLQKEQDDLRQLPRDYDFSHPHPILEAREQVALEHNVKAGRIIAEMEKVFAAMFGLTVNEIDIIQSGVKTSGLAVFGLD